MRHQQKCDQDSALSPELKEAIGDVLQSNLEQNRNVFIVRMGRGLKIVRDVKSLNVARDGVEPPTRGFSVLILCVTIGRQLNESKRLTALRTVQFSRFEHLVPNGSGKVVTK